MAATLQDPLLAAYRELTEGCALVDRGDRGKLALSGPGAVEFLNGQVTNELSDLRAGDGRYAAFLTPKGKMLGDLRVLAVGDEPPGGEPHELALDTERVALQALFDMINRYKIGYDLQVHKRTLQDGLLSLIGPRSREILQVATGQSRDQPAQREHAHRLVWIARRPARAIATADRGVDLLFAIDDAAAITEALIDAGARPVSDHAAEIVRVQAGRPRFGVDIDDNTIPEEAGLNERAVSFTKGCYTGQETVARLHYKGRPNRHLRGLRLSRPAEPGAPLLLDRREVGRLGSSVASPALGPIGLALVRREATPGTIVSVGDSRAIAAEIVALPWDATPGA